ncbi:hypothetical protein [Pseudoxanthomonas dokdonensis]|uniref:hypothetical protein n=1 Tax=Pseudoxanthomonas dokdonensis TaxID=344882 RepID=UPI0012ED3F9F|nr:hypothetical protein [Pseudoxanthomonas dokdonensis]
MKYTTAGARPDHFCVESGLQPANWMELRLLGSVWRLRPDKKPDNAAALRQKPVVNDVVGSKKNWLGNIFCDNVVSSCDSRSCRDQLPGTRRSTFAGE